MPAYKSSEFIYLKISFSQDLKYYLENLDHGTLPLDKATTQGGIVDDSNISASILSFNINDQNIDAKAGIFFSEVVGGCNCGDDPMTINAYCDVIISIDRNTNKITYSLVD